MHQDGYEYDPHILKRQVAALVVFLQDRFDMTPEVAKLAAIDLVQRFVDGEDIGKEPNP